MFDSLPTLAPTFATTTATTGDGPGEASTVGVSVPPWPATMASTTDTLRVTTAVATVRADLVDGSGEDDSTATMAGFAIADLPTTLSSTTITEATGTRTDSAATAGVNADLAAPPEGGPGGFTAQHPDCWQLFSVALTEAGFVGSIFASRQALLCGVGLVRAMCPISCDQHTALVGQLEAGTVQTALEALTEIANERVRERVYSSPQSLP